ncbi:hypothetical protein CEXT_620761 [Caerostris extrusa]|uniref:LRRNT domain-containing protein n=1 Tax=Caerostris extrusa TaxID=172846 RepID=A0AAV4X9D9_CAEEX|nr:hypothetical protein CEXT_620761 [Caerostris extrusa]
MYLTILVVVFLLGCTSGEESRLAVCPQVCDCKGLTVDCGNRQLKSVPKPLPKEAKRMFDYVSLSKIERCILEKRAFH